VQLFSYRKDRKESAKQREGIVVETSTLYHYLVADD
jgi:hypothetical protein